MCWLLAVCVIPVRGRCAGVAELTAEVDSRLRLVDLAGTPIGTAVAAGRPERTSFALTVNGCSCDILGRERNGESLVDLCRTELTRLYDRYGGIAVLSHWCSGEFVREQVAAVASESLPFSALTERFPALREDVRHVAVAAPRPVER